MKRVLFFIVLLLVPLSVNAELFELSFDANGNLLTGDGFFRVYNAANQLVEVWNGSDTSGNLLERYEWDPLEPRILVKDVFEPGNSEPVETYLYWTREFMSLINATGMFNYTFVYQDGVLIAQHVVGPGGIDELYFISADPLGTSLIVTNEFGTVVESTTFKPYGGIIGGGHLTKRDFRGKEYDSVVQDYDNGARRYNPDIASFVTPDPMRYDLQYQNQFLRSVYDPQELNPYTFARNNPYRYDDPNGLWAVQLGGSYTLFGGLAGATGGGGLAFSYDDDVGFDVGVYGSGGGLIGAGVKGGLSGDITWTPDAKRVSDLRGKSNTRGASAAYGLLVGYEQGVSDAGKVQSHTLSLGGGLGGSVHGGMTGTTATSLIGKNGGSSNSKTTNPSKTTGTKTGSTTVTVIGGTKISASDNFVKKLKSLGLMK